MNSLAPSKLSRSSNRCADLATLAELEFSAFLSAVSQSFGPEQAELSAEDWLHEVSQTDGLPTSAQEWRQFTVKVATRLANRVNTPSTSTEFITG